MHPRSRALWFEGRRQYASEQQPANRCARSAQQERLIEQQLPDEDRPLIASLAIMLLVGMLVKTKNFFVSRHGVDSEYLLYTIGYQNCASL